MYLLSCKVMYSLMMYSLSLPASRHQGYLHTLHSSHHPILHIIHHTLRPLLTPDKDRRPLDLLPPHFHALPTIVAVPRFGMYCTRQGWL
jgi:hypothetical protein